MSLQAMTWVGEYGPRPTDIGTSGEAYGPKRSHAMKLVMLGVGRYANTQGRGSRPGVDYLVTWSNYSRRYVIDCLSFLAAEGWLVIEQTGGGRGKATVYAIPFRVPERVQRSCTVSEPETVHLPTGNGAQSTKKRCTSEAVTSDDAAPNGTSNGTSNGTTVAADAATLPGIDAPVDPDALERKREREAVAEEWARVDAIVAARQRAGRATLVERVAVRSLLRKVIEHGHPWERAEAAMVECAAMTLPSIEVALNGSASKPGGGTRYVTRQVDISDRERYGDDSEAFRLTRVRPLPGARSPR